MQSKGRSLDAACAGHTSCSLYDGFGPAIDYALQAGYSRAYSRLLSATIVDAHNHLLAVQKLSLGRTLTAERASGAGISRPLGPPPSSTHGLV